MDGDDRQLFERSLRHATESHAGPALEVALDELGWHEALSADPRAAIGFFFELQGWANTSAAALGGVLSSVLGLEDRPTTGVGLPRLGHWRAPGEIVGGDLVVRGIGTASLADRASAHIVAEIGEGHLTLEVPVADLILRPVQGADASFGLIEMAGDGVPFGSQRALAPGAWPAAVARARLAIGHQLVGAARRMLELARRHALERIQFGRPISAFQAVRHRLADTVVAIEAADAALGSAWGGESRQAAAMAKALAGRSARTAARHCQQVLASIGFTTEHDLHRYVRRLLVLDELFGAARTMTRDLGNEVLADRQLPVLPPL